jgi:hypothetical protein
MIYHLTTIKKATVFPVALSGINPITFFLRELPLIEMHKAPLQSINRGLRAITSPHLIQHGTHVNPYCLFRNVKVFRNFAVATSLGDTRQDLSLSGGKFNTRHAFGKAVQSDMRKVAEAAVNVLNGV